MNTADNEQLVRETTSLKLATTMSLEELEDLRDVYNAKREGLLAGLETTTGVEKQEIQHELGVLNLSRVKVHKAISMLQVQCKEDKQLNKKSYAELSRFYSRAQARLDPRVFEELNNG